MHKNEGTKDNNNVVSKEEAEKKVSSTGIVFDMRMTEYRCTIKGEENHVERPSRITSIYNHLTKSGLVECCTIIDPRLATRKEVLLKHTDDHASVVDLLFEKTNEELDLLCYNYDSIYFHPKLTESAYLSAGCSIKLVQEILTGEIKNGVAIVRPPGHHALEHCSMGFCHFNNAALAAAVAIQEHHLKRVLIVDWDVHYGNGTHKMFESDPRVLYYSIHRYDNQEFWPCLSDGNYTEIGRENGEGYNIHVAWNKSGMGDADYKLAFENVLLPVIKEYQPQLVIVSAGFDSGNGDPLGRCKVTPKGYAWMTKQLMAYASGKVALILEGGYNLKTLATSMKACVETFLGKAKDCDNEISCDKACISAKVSVANTIKELKPYWSSLHLTEDLLKALEKEPASESSSSSSSSSQGETWEIFSQMAI